MKRKIKTVIYSNEAEYRTVCKILTETGICGHSHECRRVDSWESLREDLVDWNPGLAIVARDGAAGMEGVYLVRQQRPGVPVFWFSDDDDFSVQSHRLECTYFAAKPLTQEKLRKAFHRCAHVGIRF